MVNVAEIPLNIMKFCTKCTKYLNGEIFEW